MSGVLEAVEGAVGRLTPHLVTELRHRRDPRWMEGLWEALRDHPLRVDPQSVVPPRSKDPSGGVRPYLAQIVNQTIASDEHRWLASENFYDLPGVTTGMLELGRALLYADFVAIDDPTWWVVCGGVSTRADAASRYTWEDREFFVLNVLWFLARMRPLIEARRLILVPAANTVDFQRVRCFHWRRGFVERFGLPWPEGREPDGADYLRRLETDRAAKAAWDQWRVINHFRPTFDRWGMDFTLDSGMETAALASILGSPTDPTDQERLRTLIALPAPHVRLDVDGVLALAEDDETFASWRIAVGRAIDRASALDPEDEYHESRVRRLFADELFDVVSELRRKGEGAGWRALLAPRVGDLVLGAAGLGATAAVAAQAPDLTSALVPPILAAATRLAWAYGRGRDVKRRATAVVELYDEMRAAPESLDGPEFGHPNL